MNQEMICSYVIELEKRNSNAGAVNQFSAMMSILLELGKRTNDEKSINSSG